MPSITGGLNGAPAGRFLTCPAGLAFLWQESNSTTDSGDRGGCSHNQYHVGRAPRPWPGQLARPWPPSMHVGGSLEGRTWCSSTRGRSRGTTESPWVDVSGVDRGPLVDARSRRPSRPVVQFDRGAGLRAPGPRSADDHVDRDLQLVDVSGLDRVPLVDGDRADVSGRHAHTHMSTSHTHDPPIWPTPEMGLK